MTKRKTGKKLSVVGDELKLKKGGLYCYMPFENVDANHKAVFKIGLAIDFEKRTANTDYTARNSKIDWKALQAKRVQSLDWKAKAKKCMKPIIQFNQNGTLIKEWDSIKEAGETLKIDRSGISRCCKGKLRSVGGFIWKYKNI